MHIRRELDSSTARRLDSGMARREIVTRINQRREREAAAETLAYLAEIDRRKLYLDDGCSSMFAFCVERLGYSEDGALKRVRAARLAARLPQVLDELRNGTLHLTALFLLAQHLTNENADALIAEARGKTRKAIELVLARWFPRPDVAAGIILQPNSRSFRIHLAQAMQIRTVPERSSPCPPRATSCSSRRAPSSATSSSKPSTS